MATADGVGNAGISGIVGLGLAALTLRGVDGGLGPHGIAVE